MSSVATVDRSTNRADVEAYLDELSAMHVRHVDASSGFKAAVEKADEAMVPVLRELMSMHDAFARELGDLLRAHDRAPNSDGSWMGYVHEAVVTVRNWITGLDRDIIPGLLNGERMLLDRYDDLREMAHPGGDDMAVLTRQRNRLNQAIDMLSARAS